MFEELRVALDMGGCPNRCKHCWLGHDKNKVMQIDDLHLIYELFSPYSKKIGIYSWYREPDYLPNYQEIFEIETKLSDPELFERFELASFYRLNRDKKYAPWLKTLGIKKIQLTLFGMEPTTDFFVGRVGAFREIIKAAHILLDNGIIPRFQIFINKKNIEELPKVINLFKKEKFLEEAQKLNEKFEYFAHLGSVNGENLKNIAWRLTEKDLKKIPQELFEKSAQYLNTKNPFGISEKQLYQKFHNSKSHVIEFLKLKSTKPVFYINHKYNVYPNISNIQPWWKMGNCKKDKIIDIIARYQNDEIYALQISNQLTIKELVENVGNINGSWLFTEDDYLIYLLDLYCQKHYR